MPRRCLGSAAVVVTLTAAALLPPIPLAAQNAQPASRAVTAKTKASEPWLPPRTPWGDPDIQGVFSNADEYGLPFERPTEFEGRRLEDISPIEMAKIVELPDQLRRSLTWDQGKEMAGHAQFSVKTGVPVYFCDPRSPWQRGSNENTNGLLRQYFPKRTEIAHFTQADLDDVAAELNGRPRQTLGWKSPSQALDEALR